MKDPSLRHNISRRLPDHQVEAGISKDRKQTQRGKNWTDIGLPQGSIRHRKTGSYEPVMPCLAKLIHLQEPNVFQAYKKVKSIT